MTLEVYEGVGTVEIIYARRTSMPRPGEVDGTQKLVIAMRGRLCCILDHQGSLPRVCHTATTNRQDAMPGDLMSVCSTIL
jgi:hypothetical protein